MGVCPVSETDPFDLMRFVRAQEPVFDGVLTELRGGAKRSHWMWFIFPQIEGLGGSPTSRYYSIRNAGEARAYLDHPVLGPRLLECAAVLLALQGRSASDIFGFPDDMKLRSSMTLFASLEGADPAFADVLDRYYGCERDQRTLELLKRRAR